MAIKCAKCQTENPDSLKFCGECGTQLPSPEDIDVTATIEAPREELTTGSTFAGRYQIIEELGKGGMGKVYKALDTEIKEKVALKLIKPEISVDKKTIERFQNELKFARKISHRNVCRMYDLNKDAGSYYITMEFVSGEDLKRFIRRSGRLTISKGIDIAKQICEGLNEAHRLGVVHRDLKPGNIMIDDDGNARIMDFGIARSVEGKGITGAGVMIGTPEYMSPEQVEGKDIDHRSDIYSLGVILYEMLTGRVPFEGETALNVAVKQKTETPKNPKEYNEQISEDLCRVILKCLEKEKEKRYQSANELRSELTNIAEGLPTTEKVIPKRKPLTSREITVTFGVKKLLIPALIFVGVIVIALFMWKILSKNGAIPAPTDKPSLAVMYFENSTGDENLDHYRKAISDLLITDLSQSQHLKVLSGSKLFNILRELDLLEEISYSSSDLERVAARGGVKHILLGSYTKAGDTFRINLNLQDASTAELVASERVEGIGEESIFSMVDDLTHKIKSNFKLSQEQISADIDRDIGEITTSSPEAYKYYIEGSEYFDKGDFVQAIQSYKKAIGIDPEFATAYRSMAMAYSNMALFAERRKYVQKAFEYSNRISDRERYRNEAEYYSLSERTSDKAIEAFLKLLELYPDDSGGRNNLGMYYSELEQWDNAIEQLELAVHKYKHDNPQPYLNLADAYMAKGLYEKAIEILEYYIDEYSDNSFVRLYLSRVYIMQRDYENAMNEMNRSIDLNPDFPFTYYRRGINFHVEGDWANAERDYNFLINSRIPSAKLIGYSGLVNLSIDQGNFEKAESQAKQGIELAKKLNQADWETWLRFSLSYVYYRTMNLETALNEIEKAWDPAVETGNLSNQRWARAIKGIVYVHRDLVPEAQKTADQLDGLIQEGSNKNAIRLSYLLKGEIEKRSGNFSSAIELLNKAIALLPFENDITTNNHALYLESLADAYYRSGDLEKALETFEKITLLTVSRIRFGDIYVQSFYMLGKIHEEQSNIDRAIASYEKFLDLWKDADPGIEEVEDAKRRIADLKN
ncbi:MAG: protein kinase [Candidatus Aminicenantes bacterium]|jgi:serine/threonine protein kinase/Flp pilus assembly protein TadD